MACSKCGKNRCGCDNAVVRRGPMGPKGPPGKDGRIRGTGTENCMTYAKTINSRGEIEELATSNLTYQKANVIAAGSGGGVRYLSTDNLGNLSWQTVSGAGIGGGGTLNYIAKFTPDGMSIGDSRFYESSTESYVKNSFGNKTFDFENAQINTKGGAASIDAEARTLTKTSGDIVLDYENQWLFKSATGGVYNPTAIYAGAFHTKVFDFPTMQLFDGGGTDVSVDLQNRQLLKTGSQVVVDWGTETITSYTAGGLSATFGEISILGAAQQGTAGQVLTTDGLGGLSWTTVSGSSGITSLNGLTGASQTFVDDTNVTIVSSGTTHTITWAGTLADARIASAATWNAKQSALSGTGIVKSTAGTISYLTDNSANWDTAYTNRITTANSPLSIASNTISISQATTSTSGYLSSTDWNTFNGKGNGTVTSVSVTTANGVSGSVATSTTNPAITLTLGAITPTTVNGLTITTTTGTITVTNGTTITMPASTSTVLANNLGISGGSTLVSGTAATDKLIIKTTSGNQVTGASDLVKIVSGNNGANELLRIGDGIAANIGELSMWAAGQSSNTTHLLRAGTNFTYINAGTDLRLMVGASNVIICSSTTATMSLGITISDGKNIVLNTTTGTKIGTGTTQKLALWNKTPIVQPTTAISVTASFVANTSANFIYRESTIGGYTFEQIAQALINLGALA